MKEEEENLSANKRAVKCAENNVKQLSHLRLFDQMNSGLLLTMCFSDVYKTHYNPKDSQQVALALTGA